MAVKLLIADDHTIIREGLRSLIEREPDFMLVAEAKSGHEAVLLAQQHEPDVVIIDIGMPDLNGIDAASQIRARAPKARVIALSMHSDKLFVSRMLEAGAAGYLLKECAFEELVHAVRSVIADKVYLSPAIAGAVVKDYLAQLASKDPSGLQHLTQRERETLQLYAEGRTTKQIAELLGVSSKTVETYRQQTMAKLDLRSIAALTKYAIRVGLTSIEQ
ncbi:response regulator transcription factor [bacterium]|nr:response regulator transcription factor [bacterium]